MSKIGRNEHCPCGSGKKYKKCCLQQETPSQPIADMTYQKIRKVERALIDDHLRPYLKKTLPPQMAEEAAIDFYPSELHDEIEHEALIVQLFLPWMLFDWVSGDNAGIAHFDPKKTIAENYLEQHPAKLSKDETRFIKALGTTYFSFYSISEVNKGRGLVVKDCLTGTTHQVTENKATHYLDRGDIVFGRLLHLDERTLFVGFSPHVIPARYQMALIHFRDWLIEEVDGEPLDAWTLRNELDLDILDYYFEVLDELFSPQMPQIQNSDGDELQFTKSYFKLSTTPEDALTRLAPLTLAEDLTRFLSEATRDAHGAIVQLEFPWLKQGNQDSHTVLGHITLENNRLILETNSSKRDEEGQKLIKHYLKDNAHFQNTLIESVHQKIQNHLEKGAPTPTGSNELLEHPEVQEYLKDMAESHWQAWFDEAIPALGNLTPKEAAKTKEGRELLEALLLYYESDDREGGNNLLKPDTKYLRGKLGLCETAHTALTDLEGREEH